MGMKVLILLSLAGICLANGPKGRSGFVFPGQPTGQNGKHNLIWNDFSDIVQRNAESESQSDQVSSEENFVLRNPNRRDVISGNILAPGVPGSPEDSSQGNEPLFTENASPVLEKENSSSEESNGSDTESSSSEQSSESAAVNNQQDSSSSEEDSASAAKEGVSKLSETNTPAVNQEQSSSSEENLADAVDQEKSSAIKERSASSNDSNNKNETPSSNSGSGQNTPNNEDAQATVVSKSKKLAAMFGLQPFVVANSPKKAERQLVFSLRDVDGLRPPPSRKAKFSGPRAVRGIENSLFIPLKNEKIIPGPQVQTKKRLRRPVKK